VVSPHFSARGCDPSSPAWTWPAASAAVRRDCTARPLRIYAGSRRATAPAPTNRRSRWHAVRGQDSIQACWQAMDLEPLARPADAFGVAHQERVMQRVMRGERELLDQLGLAGDDDARITVVADERWMRLVTRLQCLLRERLARCRITLEVNPTSNLLIGGFNDYAELPYRVMTDSGLALSINTDDPGLFMTSLPNEFAALYHALVGPMRHQEASQWLQGRRLDAANSTFLGLGTPIGADAAACIRSGAPFVFMKSPMKSTPKQAGR